jgi:hypothetical protein
MSIEEEGTNHGVKESEQHLVILAKGIPDKELNYGDRDAVKLQSFVRGALCRARVSLIVKKLIDDLLAERASSLSAAKEQSTGQSSTEQADDSGEVVLQPAQNSSPPQDAQENIEPKGESRKEAIATFDALNELLGGSFQDASESDNNTMKMENMEDLHKSVGDILSKFEANIDPNAAPPVRNWSPAKGKKSPVKAGFEKMSSSAGVPEAPLGRNSVRGKKIENNSTRHVLSSEEILHQHEVRLKQ